MRRTPALVALALLQWGTLGAAASAWADLKDRQVPAASTSWTREAAESDPLPARQSARPEPTASPVHARQVRTAVPAPRHKHAPRVAAPQRVTRAAQAPTSTPAQRLQEAIRRVPGYRPGLATWEVTDRYGSWGTTNLSTGQVWISPEVPSSRIYDVVVHEWSHVLSVQVYDGDVRTALAAMRDAFGGEGIVGAERAADCMARELGARWTHYTSCSSPDWQLAARQLLAGSRL